jgi:putative transposase
MLPFDFPDWKLDYYYFTKWKYDGTIEMIHEILRDMARKKAGRNESTSLAIIDSQFFKATRSGGLCRGTDGGKKTKGRKRHFIVDTMGLLLAVDIHAANEHDGKSAINVIAELRG